MGTTTRRIREFVWGAARVTLAVSILGAYAIALRLGLVKEPRESWETRHGRW